MAGSTTSAFRKRSKGRRDPVLRELAQSLRERFGAHIRDIILFGSRARGDHGKDSDYDVLVLVDEKTTQIDEAMFGLCCDIGFRRGVFISLFVEARSVFDHRVYEPLFINARHEGVAL